MNTIKNMENRTKKKASEQLHRELEARVAELNALQIEPEITKSIALRESVADQVFEIMQAQGITQADLARRLGKSRAHVCKILGGANLTLDSLASLSIALGCEINLQFGSSKSIATNAKLSDWKNIKRPGLELIPGGLSTRSSWSNKMPSFDRQEHFISTNTKQCNLMITDQKVTEEELEIAA